MPCVIRMTILLLCCGIGLGADCEFDERKFSIGESFQIAGQCATYHCDAEGSISAISCAESLSTTNCKTIPEDNSKPYPDCCKRNECGT